MASLSHEHLGIAIVDDDDVYRSFVSALLSKNSSFAVFEASSGDELLQTLDSQQIDCIVLDYNLGTESGFAIKDRLANRYATVPPIVMLTGDGRESTVIKALRLGINDYLPKLDLKAEALISAISRVVLDDRKELQTKAEYERLARASAFDLVTGLVGRTSLDARLAQIAAFDRGSRSAYALILVEMIELQKITESLGIKAGDQALRAFGKRLQLAARSNDICGRYSENGFLVIINVKSDASQLEAICERLASQLAFRLELNTTSLEISAFVGAALCGQVKRSGVIAGSDLIEPARQALKSAKASGVRFRISETESPEGPSSGAAGDTAEQPAADGLRTTDRRGESRHRVLKRGQILVTSVGASIDCTVRNQSSRGAGLRINATFAVPAEFELVITGDGIKRRVQVRWQIGNDLGVEYIAA